jgi:hypothetical protein
VQSRLLATFGLFPEEYVVVAAQCDTQE